jgi:hypothetical protein
VGAESTLHLQVRRGPRSGALRVLTGVGALINIGVYWTWLAWKGVGSWSIVAGVAAGSVAALSFNFFASRAIFVKSL